MSKMGSNIQRVYLFGDQTFDFDSSFRQLLLCDNALLKDFFVKAFAALQAELHRVPSSVQDLTPKFSSLGDLLTRKRDGDLSPALEQALCAVHSLAHFIWRHSDGQTSYPSAQNSHIIGICTGALAAAAVSASSNLVDLIPHAVDAVVAALHCGLTASLVGKSMSGENANTESSWSLVLAGAEPETIEGMVGDFNSNLPPATRVYLSAYVLDAITISGPPDSLSHLVATDKFRRLVRVALPIRAPYHAPHLYGEEHVADILQHVSEAATLRLDYQPIPIISCGNAELDWSVTLSTKLEVAVRDILLRPVMLGQAVRQLAGLIRFVASSQVTIIPIGTLIGDSVHGYLARAVNDTSSVLGVAAAPSPPSSPLLLRGPMNRPKIAVVGMSGRFPGASDVEGLWDVLMNKIDMCREVPGMRWNAETHVDPRGKERNKSKVRYGCWIDNPDLFDARFFSISPREAAQVDPAQRIALMTAYEALESAGIVPGRTPSTREDRVGVFFGVTSNDWCEANSNQDIDTYFIPGANRAFVPGRINYCFKFSGPSYAVDTACSSSLSALHIAFNSLLQGDIDMAIAGGTNVLTNPDMTCGLDRGHFLSSTGNCKTFDASADGYCRGEGVATVILKRLEDAIQDNDPIIGVISGACTNHSAEAESITRPHVGAQRDILSRVLSDSGTDPYDVGYIEMHGTGTQAGDLREMQSVCSVFAPNDKRHKRAPNQPLHLGALKSNIGHGESVSGVSALVKVLLMMEKNMIPPHCGIKTKINPAFPKDLKERHVFINTESVPWQKDGRTTRKAIINNFSAAGGNSTILVEDAPQLSLTKTNAAASSRPTFPVAVTARSAKSLKENLKALIHYTGTHQPDLAHLSYTTTARRMHHAHRVMVVGSSIQDTQAALKSALEQETGAERAVQPKNLLFTFTGQGAQYAGMGRRLYQELSVFRHQLQHLNLLVQQQGFPSILPLFTADPSVQLGEFQPVVVQLANTCMQIALAHVWMSWGLKPTSVVGHSLGEYAALNVAGVLSDAGTIYLVGRRAQHLQDLCESGSHAMLAVMASESEIEAALAEMPLQISCVNGPKETVIAGTVTQVTEMRQILVAKGIRSTLLNTPYAFHTSQIDPVRAPLVEDAKHVTFYRPKIPVLSSLLGRVVAEDGVFGAEYVGRQARERVRMMQALQAGFNAGIIDDKTYGIEFGPHPVVAGMVKSCLGSAVKVLPTLRRNVDPFEVLTESLSALFNAGSTIRWDEYFGDIPRAQTVIPLPAYRWDLQSYWIEYRNDFCLYKGDGLRPPTAPQSSIHKKIQEGLPRKPADDPEPVPALESSTIHKIVSEQVSATAFAITTECDVGRKDINRVMQGHKVDGIGLSTPSVYGDIGFSLGTHVLERFNRSSSSGKTVNVSHMEIEKALIGSAKHKQFLRCAAKFDLLKWEATCVFSTHDENGNLLHQHATCRITFSDQSNRKRLQSQLPEIKARFEEMRRNSATGRTFRFNIAMAYNMVSKLAEFDPDYQCVDETVYDNENYEAACTVSFGRMKKGGSFHTHPAVLDGLTQSGGFTMNANENTNLEKDVFVNHGWDGFELYETIRDDCQYHTHVKMSPAENGQWKGDMVIFTGDLVVGFIKGVCLQGVPRRVLKYILTSSASPPKTASGPPEAAATASSARQKEARALPRPEGASSEAARPPAANDTPAAAARPESSGQAQRVVEVIARQALIDPNTLKDDGRSEEKQGSSALAAAVDQALAIISEETRVDPAGLSDQLELAEVGVDSLLLLVISSRLYEELELDVSPDTLGVECCTIARFKDYVAKHCSMLTTGEEAAKPCAPTVQLSDPALVGTFEEEQGNSSTSTSTSQSLCFTPPLASQGSFSQPDMFANVLKIVAEETGVAIEELRDSTDVADAGIDSLLSLIIASRLRDELDMDLGPDSVLLSLQTIGQLRALVEGQSCSRAGTNTPETERCSSNCEFSRKCTNDADSASSVSSGGVAKAAVPETRSVVLQGNPRIASQRVLFFFPDGSGSATSYMQLPKIMDGLTVYGLNSPFLQSGDAMCHVTFDQLVHSYLAEVRRRQPSGPYSFAGWSAGGTLAFRAAQLLIAQGEQVDDLILLDAPVPGRLGVLPQRFFDFCQDHGFFGDESSRPSWLFPHFKGLNLVLNKYDPVPFTHPPRNVHLVWAEKGSFQGTQFAKRLGDPDDLDFLLNDRTDFTPGGWAKLVPGVTIRTARAEGESHFTMLASQTLLEG